MELYDLRLLFSLDFLFFHLFSFLTPTPVFGNTGLSFMELLIL